MASARAFGNGLPTFMGSSIAILCIAWRDLIGAGPALALFVLGGAAMVVTIALCLDMLGAILASRALSSALPRRVTLGLLCVYPPVLAALLLGSAALSWHPLPLLALAGAAAALALHRVCTRRALDVPALWVSACAAASQLMLLFTALHLALGTFSAVRPGTERMHLAVFAGSWLASLVLCLPWALRIQARRGRRPEARLLALPSIIAIAMGLAFIEIDRRALVGLYPAAHRWLEVVAVLSIDAGLAPWLVLRARDGATTTRHRAAMIGGALVAAILVAAAALFHWGPSRADSPAFRAAIMQTSLGPGLLELFPNTSFLDQPGGPIARHPLLDHAHYRDLPWTGPRLNILLITIDTLRADALPEPGASDTSAAPNLAALAAGCADFRWTYAVGPRTALSMGALMLGRYSANIQWQLWIWNFGELYDPRTISPETLASLGNKYGYTTLPAIPERGNLAQRLQAAGYTTAATPYGGTSEFFRKGVGFDTGFQDYGDLTGNVWNLPTSPRIADAALAQLERVTWNRDGRFFQWVHYYDPHAAGPYKKLYDQLVRDVDRAIGRTLDALDRAGLRDDTAIVVLADHGDAFGEHGHQYHGTSLYEEEMRVPMLICIPGVAPRVFRDKASIIDATATMLALAGADTGELDGVNLLPVITGDRPYPEKRPVFIENNRYQSTAGKRTADMKAVILDDWKYIVDRLHYTAALYNLAEDPGERRSRVTEHPELAEDLHALLFSFVGLGESRHPLP